MFTGQTSKSIQFIFTNKFQMVFLFSVLFCKNVQYSFLIYAFDNNCLFINIYIRNKRRLLVISGTWANEKCPNLTVALSTRYRDRPSWRIRLKVHSLPAEQKVSKKQWFSPSKVYLSSVLEDYLQQSLFLPRAETQSPTRFVIASDGNSSPAEVISPNQQIF